MKTGFWIARRFSFARKRFRVINVISAISLAGIVVGVCTLLVVMSVLNGFQELARDLFVSIDSPAQIMPLRGRTIAVSEALLRAIRALEGVGAAEPFAEGESIFGSGEKSELVVVKGLSLSAHRRLMLMTKATHPFFTEGTVAAGGLLAYRTNVGVGSDVRIFSPDLIALGLESLLQPYLVPLLGIPETRVSSLFSLQKVFDDRYILTSDLFAHRILLLPRGAYSGIDIRPLEGYSRDAFISNLRVWLAKSEMRGVWKVRTLEEKYSNIFSVMELEKWASFCVLMLIVLVAALSLTGALAMTAIDKQRELFYLRCLGLEKPQLMSIFIIQGGMTGVAGSSAGMAIAWCVCKLQDLYGIVPLPSKSAFIIPAYPVCMRFDDFLAVGVTGVVLCIAGSIYPAVVGSRQ